MMTATAIRKRLRAHAEPSRVAVLQRFFKTGPGEYAHGDVFIGVRLPGLRTVCRECRGTSLDVLEPLLQSRIHEERLLALLLLVDAFARAEPDGRRRTYDFYVSHTACINNWDLVDCSAPHIVGAWLQDRDRAPLRRLARSRLLWDRRIAIVATHHFIRRGEVRDTFDIARLLLNDSEDLIHKATGWMLREAEKRDPMAARKFLDAHGAVMPRTMLRYAIERFAEPERLKYLRARAARA